MTVPSWLTPHADLAAQWQFKHEQLARRKCAGCERNEEGSFIDAEFMRKVEVRNSRDALNLRLQKSNQGGN